MNIKGQGVSFMLVQGHSDSTFLNFFPSVAADFDISLALR